MKTSDPTTPPEVSSGGSDRERPAGWLAALAVYRQPSSLRMLALGFAAGLPYLLIFGTLSFWLREAGVNLATIGFVSWVGGVFAFKWCWSPLVDRLPIPLLTRWLGRRRSWLLLAQVGVVVALCGIALSDPKISLSQTITFAVMLAFCAATQDIALDAYRIESAGADEQSALSAAYQIGYRLAMIWAGAGALLIAARAETPNPAHYDPLAWRTAYLAMAASMIIGWLTVLLSPEPARAPLPPAKDLRSWLTDAVVSPFADFIRRYRWHAVLVLALIATYRVSDIVIGIMAYPFYKDMGYSKEEVAAISKVYGVIMTLVGALLGGVLSKKIGLMRTLMLGAVLSSASNLLYAWLTTRGHDLSALTAVISIDNLSSGIAATAFIAYMSSLTNISYSATQYAMLSSMMLLFPKWLAGFSGVAVERMGYANFFTGTAVIGIPVLLLIWLASRLLAHRDLRERA